MLKNDIRRAIFSKPFLFALLLLVLATLYQSFATISSDDMQRVLKHGDFNAIGTLNRYLFAFSASVSGNFRVSFISFMIPLIIALPCGNLFLEEVRTGYIKNALHRTGKFKYVFSKLLAAGLAGIVLMGTAMLLVLGICFLIDPAASPHLFQFEMDQFPFQQLYDRSMTQYALAFSGNALLYGFVYSILTLGFSSLWNNKYFAYVTPFILQHLVGSILYGNGITPGFAPAYEIGYLQQPYTYASLVREDMVLLAVGIILFTALFMYRRQRYV